MTCMHPKYISLLHCCHLSLTSIIVNAPGIWAPKLDIFRSAEVTWHPKKAPNYFSARAGLGPHWRA